MRLARTPRYAALLIGTLAASHASAASPSDYARAVALASSPTARRLIFDDAFNGPAGGLPRGSTWQAVTGGNGWGNRELEYYTSRLANVGLDGKGHLVITARREPYTADGVSGSYTSARLQTKGRFQTTYGELLARIKLPAGQGLWPAFWALGSDFSKVGWPAAGEIDIMEELGSDPFTVYGAIHGPSRTARDGFSMPVAGHSRASLASGFHVYGVTWSRDAVSFTLDGVAYAARTKASLRAGDRWVFNTPFYLLLNVAVGGVWPGSPNRSTPFPARMLVDWVRIYS